MKSFNKWNEISKRILEIKIKFAENLAAFSKE